MAKRTKRAKPQANNLFAQTLILLGALLLALSILTHSQIYARYLISQKESPVIEYSYEVPANISIPSVDIKVGIEQGGIVDGEWVLSKNKALFLPTSGKLGEGYNTIIYAHNKSKLFGNLKKVKPGDLITIEDSAGKEYSYEVFFKEVVSPNSINKLYSKEKDIVTLFTCDGWADKTRLLVKARLQ